MNDADSFVHSIIYFMANLTETDVETTGLKDNRISHLHGIPTLSLVQKAALLRPHSDKACLKGQPKYMTFLRERERASQ